MTIHGSRMGETVHLTVDGVKPRAAKPAEVTGSRFVKQAQRPFAEVAAGYAIRNDQERVAVPTLKGRACAGGTHALRARTIPN
jgi:hypothetical protein